MPTFFEKKQLVTPGELLAEGDYLAGENTYLEEKKIYAARIGLADLDNKKVNVVALRAFYIPKIGDIVIGTILEVGFNGWSVDIKAPYTALLRASDVLSRPFKPQNDELSQVLNAGDLIVAKIASYDRAHDPQLTVGEPGLGKITRGQIMRVNSNQDSPSNRQERFYDFHDKTRNRLPDNPRTQRSNIGHWKNNGGGRTRHDGDSKDRRRIPHERTNRSHYTIS
jgi:exosome complex RNA-binding protein Rrp4